MSPWELRTVTGVFTSATRTLTLACVSLGGNWTSTPGLGGRGPEGDCGRAGSPATARRNVRVRDATANRIIRITWYRTMRPRSKQPKLRPLESINYEMLFLQVV